MNHQDTKTPKKNSVSPIRRFSRLNFHAQEKSGKEIFRGHFSGRFCALLALIICITLAHSSFVLTNADLAGAWNIAIAYSNGVGYGSATLASGSPYGSLTTGSDTIVYFDGRTDTNSAQSSFRNFFQAYAVHPSGLFAAESTTAGLTADLVDTLPADRIVGTIADTSAAAIFFGLRLFPGMSDELFVGVKSNALSLGQMLGASGIDTFVGASLSRSKSDTYSIPATFTFARVSDTAVSFRAYRAGDSLAQAPIGCSISLLSGGGVTLWNPTIALTQSFAAASGHFRDTDALYRTIFTSDTNLAVIVRDSSPAAQDSLHAQFIAFAVRRRAPVAIKDIIGPWQAAMLVSESNSFNATLGHFEFRTGGTGIYDNGLPPPYHSAKACTVVLSGDTLGGATRGDSYFLITMRPERDSAEVQLRAYLSADSRILSMTGFRTSDRMIGLGARRANSVRRQFSFNTTDTPISRTRLSIGLRVDSGACTGVPTFLFSPLDSSLARIRSFRNFRDTALRNAGIDTIHGAVSITPDTTIRADSVIITIDIQGASDSRGATNLIPLIFEDESGVWTRIPEESVTARNTGVVSFRPPHFSDFGVGEGEAGATSFPNADFSSACMITNAAFGTHADRMLPMLRTFRDLLLATPLGISIVDIYYSFTGILMALAIPFSMFLRARRA